MAVTITAPADPRYIRCSKCWCELMYMPSDVFVEKLYPLPNCKYYVEEKLIRCPCGEPVKVP